MGKQTRTARQFMSLIGSLNSTFSQVAPIGRMHIRPIQWQLGRSWSEGQSYNKPIRVPHSMHCHLKWWGCSHVLRAGTSLHAPSPDVVVFTDASNIGWGAHSLGEEIQGNWLDSEIYLHINVLEMKAVLIAIRHFAPQLRGKVVLFLCDNITTLWHLRKAGGVKVWHLNA